MWESGEVENPPIDVLASVLDFPEGFFRADDSPEVRPEWMSFRALSNMSARQVSRVAAAASISVEFAEWIDSRYKTSQLDMPLMPEDGPQLPPAVMAENTRSAWGLSDKPVGNLLALLEKHGIRVFSLPGEDRKVDAFSFYREGAAYIFLNTMKSAERLRFDLAHELGHLIMHRDRRKNLSREAEQEANDFASSFLVSADRLNAQVVGALKLDDVFTLKRYWRVSAMAMVERLWRLKHVSEWSRRQWIIELTNRGYRTSEPDGIPPDRSKFFAQLFHLMREDGYSLRKVAAELNLRSKYLDDCVFGLSISSVDGEAEGSRSRRLGHLRMVT
jgi:Zn-dependent peptidase ImmA (M78 family)